MKTHLVISLLFGGLLQMLTAQNQLYPGNPRVLSITVEVPSGFSSIANPYDHWRILTNGELTTLIVDNTLATLMPQMPHGTKLFKYDSVPERTHVIEFERSGWRYPSETLSPSEGAMIFNPSGTNVLIKFTGFFPVGLTVEIKRGVSIISCPDIVFTPPPEPPYLQLLAYYFLPQDGDRVSTYDPDQHRFKQHTYHAGIGWDSVPQVGWTESFRVFTKHPRNITFSVGFGSD